MNDLEFISDAYSAILGRAAAETEVASCERDLSAGVCSRETLMWQLLRCEEFQKRTRSLEFVPAGHFYSAVPSRLDRKEALRDKESRELGEIDLRQRAQKQMLKKLGRYMQDCPFRAEPIPELRYHYENPAYSWTDGYILYAMLRHFQPKRVIEVGSGYSSALMLDVRDRFLPGLELTFIEPYADLLRSLLRAEDSSKLQILEQRVQDVDLAVFRSLRAGDILFIDSTHVSKLHSDVNFLFFQVLPALAKGVIIHIHDIFHGLEYPKEWIREGRAWNELYLLRAFLMNNHNYRVLFFNSFVHKRFKGWIQEHLPDLLKNPGGSFWMQKRVAPAKLA